MQESRKRVDGHYVKQPEFCGFTALANLICRSVDKAERAHPSRDRDRAPWREEYLKLSENIRAI